MSSSARVQLAVEDMPPTEVASVATTEIDAATTDIETCVDSPAGDSGPGPTQEDLSAGSGLVVTGVSARSPASNHDGSACPLASPVGLVGADQGEAVLPYASDTPSSYSYTPTPSPDEDLWECPHCHHFVVPAYRRSYCLSTNSP